MCNHASYAEHLVEASLEKLGRDGVTKKLVARRKREENKRRKEEQAALARQRMTAGHSANAGNGAAATASAGNPSGGGEDSKEIKKLRSSLLRMAKKSMGFERSGAPSNWRFEVPGTSGATFAALMGRPGDVRRTSHPTAVLGTSVGRLTDVCRMSDGRLSDIRRDFCFEGWAHSFRCRHLFT